MLGQRVISAIVIVIAAVIPAVLGQPVLALALLALAILGTREFSRALESKARVLTLPSTIVVGSTVLVGGLTGSHTALLGAVSLGSILIWIAALVRAEIQGSTRDYALSLVPVIYIGLPLAYLSLIRDIEGDSASGWLQRVNDFALTSSSAAGLGWLVLIVASTWMTDSAAYLGGRAFGRTKLAPTLSPAKTREGAASGAIAGALTGAVAVAALGLDVPLYVGAVIGFVLSVLGQAGDLAESIIKRDLGIKDMGDLIPGHGGVLDRIDALLFTLPAGYFLIWIATEVNWP
jgi:phosphatidate cytidylyltransferase